MTRPNGRLDPAAIRYIKLGRAGGLEERCINEGICYIGFGTGDSEIFDIACQASISGEEAIWGALWDELYKRESDRSEQQRKTAASQARNQIRSFYTAGEETLWITFFAGRLYFTTLDNQAKPQISSSDRGSFRRVLGEWSCTDANGKDLSIESLSGQITKTQLFRGTSCEITDGPREYLLRRLNGEQHDYISAIEKSRCSLETGIVDAIKALTPQDFELLTELVFSRTYRRVGSTGKVQKFVDIVFENPIVVNGRVETICVQVKSQTTISKLLEYLADPQRETYGRFYYVFHTSADLTEDFELPLEYQDEVQIIGVQSLATLVVETGLITWLTNKAG